MLRKKQKGESGGVATERERQLLHTKHLLVLLLSVWLVCVLEHLAKFALLSIKQTNVQCTPDERADIHELDFLLT